MDPEDLIICVAVWTLYKRRGPMVCDELLASCRASRNRARPRLHFFAPRVDFATILGGVGKPKWTRKSIFGQFFAMHFSNAFLDRFFGKISLFFLRVWRCPGGLQEKHQPISIKIDASGDLVVTKNKKVHDD